MVVSSPARHCKFCLQHCTVEYHAVVLYAVSHYSTTYKSYINKSQSHQTGVSFNHFFVLNVVTYIVYTIPYLATVHLITSFIYGFILFITFK